MEKFSLYDLLAALFPSVIFLYMLNATHQLFGILLTYPLTHKWKNVLFFSYTHINSKL